MKMFPHAFAPLPPMQAPVRGKQTVAHRSYDGVAGNAPINLDVERLVAVMLSASDTKKDLQYEQQCRRQVMRKVPPESIDWDSVNWVRLWPFETRRQPTATD
jgi:hypothetical protein